jgi:hypothetical protein
MGRSARLSAVLASAERLSKSRTFEEYRGEIVNIKALRAIAVLRGPGRPSIQIASPTALGANGFKRVPIHAMRSRIVPAKPGRPPMIVSRTRRPRTGTGLA